MPEATKESLEAVVETAEAHADSTGHDEVNMIVAGQLPVVLVVSCSACGASLGRVSADSRQQLGEAMEEVDTDA